MTAPLQGKGRLTLTVIGSGAILCSPDRNPPGYVLHDPVGGRDVLLDPGPGCYTGLYRAGLDPRRIDRVLITHLHIDHHVDLLSLLFARHIPTWREADDHPLVVAGPPPLEAVLDAWGRLYGETVTRPGWVFRPLVPGEHSLDHLLLKAAPARHIDHALSYHLQIPGLPTLCYTGDTDENPELVVLARDADVLLCECSHPDERPVPGHMTPSRAGRLARDARVGHLILTHLYPTFGETDPVAQVRREWEGPVHLACDRETYAF